MITQTTPDKPSINEEIDTLGYQPALFCLKVLAAAGHVTDDVVRQTIDLAKSVRFLNGKGGRLGDLLEVARIKCTRRFQGEDYPGAGGEYRLGVDATSHLREVLTLIEEAQKCQSQQ